LMNLRAALDQLYHRLNRTDHPLIVERYWNVNPTDPQDQIHIVASAQNQVALPAMLGLSPGESQISDIAEVIGADKYNELEKDLLAKVIYLSNVTAEQLGVKEGGAVDI